MGGIGSVLDTSQKKIFIYDSVCNVSSLLNPELLCKNDAPTISSIGGTTNGMLYVDENKTAVFNLDNTNPQGDTENGNGLIYSLSGPDALPFSIDKAGKLVFASAPDFEYQRR